MTLKTISQYQVSRLPFLAPDTGSGDGGSTDADKGSADDKTGDDAKGDEAKIDGLDDKTALGGDDKAAGDEGDEAKEGEDSKTEDKVEAPEKFELKPIEGFAALDDAAMEAATPLLKKLGVTTNEQAQEVVNDFAKEVLPKMLERAQVAAQTAQVEQITAIRKEWHDQTLADAEIGGSDHAAKMAIAAKAVEQFGGDKLRELFNQTGIGNHPEVVRAFYRAGQAIQEGAMHRSDGAEQRKKDDGELFYGDAYKKQEAAA
jgi:hypothetical protein